MRLIVSSLLPHNIHLLFCCILSILALIGLVLMVVSCAAIKRDSVSLLKFLFLRHVQVFSSEMLFISRLKRHQSCFSSHFCFLVIVHSVVQRVVSIVSYGCNQSFFVLFSVVLESLYQCINAIFNAGKSSSYFLS